MDPDEIPSVSSGACRTDTTSNPLSHVSVFNDPEFVSPADIEDIMNISSESNEVQNLIVGHCFYFYITLYKLTTTYIYLIGRGCRSTSLNVSTDTIHCYVFKRRSYEKCTWASSPDTECRNQFQAQTAFQRPQSAIKIPAFENRNHKNLHLQTQEM